MTEKNADVEWLRAELEAWKGFSPENCAFRLNLGYFRRLLAHIDQLEAEKTAALSRPCARCHSVTGAVSNGMNSDFHCSTCYRELEAENARLIEVAEDKIDINVRPTIHEIAPMLVAALLACVDKERECRWSALAADAYRGAEALVAEGRRRDGQGS